MSEVLVARDDHVATLTLNRPDAANALSRSLLSELADAVASLAAEADVRAVVVTGSGEKAFCAGADLKERAGMAAGDVAAAVARIRETITAIADLPVPAIAAVNGAALGGGLEIALACDLRIASATASMGLTETSLAIIPGGGGTQRLARLIGPGRAKDLIFTARRLSAEEALAIGLVHEIVEPGLLAGRAAEMAQRIAANGPVAVRAAKEAIDSGLELPLEEGLRLEGELYARTIETEDRLEGLAAFMDKRAPQYRGR